MFGHSPRYNALSPPSSRTTCRSMRKESPARDLDVVLSWSRFLSRSSGCTVRHEMTPALNPATDSTSGAGSLLTPVPGVFAGPSRGGRARGMVVLKGRSGVCGRGGVEGWRLSHRISIGEASQGSTAKKRSYRVHDMRVGGQICVGVTRDVRAGAMTSSRGARSFSRGGGGAWTTSPASAS
jgi:hypothetical protein